MPGTPTPNLGLLVPTVGGDLNSWGAELNADLAIIDQLGVNTTLAQGASFTAVAGIGPITVYRLTTGAANINVNLPAAATCIGKTFVFKKADAGLGSAIILGSIDGQASYILSNQYQYLTVVSNGATFDVIGNG